MKHIVTRRVAAGLIAAAGIFGGLPLSAFAQNGYAPPPTNGPSLTLRLASNAVGASPMAPVQQAIIKQFQEDYPNVKIRFEGSPGNDHQTKIKLDASSNRLPDLFSYWRMDPSFGLDQIVDAGLVADLTEWAKNDPAFKDLFDQSSWNTATRKGVVRGVPLNMFYVYFGANPDIFRRARVEIPKNWEDLLTATDKLKAAGEIPWGISIGKDSQGGRIYNLVVNRVVGNERALRMHSAQEPINVPDMLKVAQLVQQLVVGKVPTDAIAIDNGTAYAKYVNDNRGAMWVDGSFALGQVSDAVRDKMVVLSFPTIPGGVEQEPRTERDLSTLWYVSAKAYAEETKRPYIQELIRRLSSRAAGKTYAELAKQSIPMLGTKIDPAVVGSATIRAQEIALAHPGNKWIPTVMSPEQRSRFEPLLSEFLNGKHTPQAFVERLGTIFTP